MKKLLTLLTLLLCVVVGAKAEETVTVKWFPSTMTSENFTVSGTADVTGLMTVKDVTHSTPVSDPVYRSKTTSWAKFTSTNVNVNGSNKNRWLATDYIIFSVEIADGVTFTPTKVTATAAGSGSSGCNAGLFNAVQGSAQSGQSSGIAQEQNGGKALSLTSFAKDKYVGGETLTFYIHIGIPSDKAISIQDVILTGTYTQSDKTKWSKPTFSVGEYDQEAGKYPVTMSAEEGASVKYTIDGTTETIASGSVVNVAPETSIEAVATGGDLTDSDAAILVVPSAPKVETPVFSVGAFDWETLTYPVTISGAAGSTIYYIIGDGSASEYTGSFDVSYSTTVQAYAEQSNMTRSDVVSVTIAPAPRDGKATTVGGGADSDQKDNNHDLVGGYIPGTYIAGVDGSNGLKLRAGRATSVTDVTGLEIKVNEGYKIISVSFSNARSNNSTAITINGAYVDGTAVSVSESSLPASDSKVAFSLDDISAKESVVLDLGTEASQYRASITVTYVSLKNLVALSAAGWATLYTGKALDFSGVEGLEAYTATLSDGKVTLAKVDNVQANTGIVLKSTVGAKNFVVSTADASTTAKGDLKGSATESTAMDAANTYYGLTVIDSKAQFAKLNAGGTIAAGKAYLMVEGSSARAFFDIEDSETTGINNVAAQQRNGQVYNLQGQRVENVTKGLYIMNGKKYIAK